MMERKLEILIVDDDVSLSSNLQDILETEEYSTAVAHDGQTALTLCRKKPPDLALIDIKLPDMSGAELIQRLAKLAPEVEYIIITGYASLNSAINAVARRDIVAYETKPLDMDRMLTLIRQVIERKHAEKALRQERNRAQKYLDVAGVMLVALDATQKVTLINKKGCEILGGKEEEIVGKNWFDNFVPDRIRYEAVAVFDKLMAGEIKGTEYYENPVLTKPGGETLIDWHNTVLTDETGDIIGILGSGQDITERQLLWKKMVEYEELSKLKSDLLSTVSHELRAPLAIIKGYSTMLLDYNRRISSKEKNEHLHSIDKATDRLTDLVDHLLDMPRMDAGLLKLEMVPTNITKVIEQAVAEARFRAPKHNILIHQRNRPPKVKIDAKRIRQVIDNLIDNACKYSDEGTEVVVSTQLEGQELVVSVTDHGVGIPAEELKLVFDRMYRAEQRLSAGGEGLGLGLSICKGLVEAHGGCIWVESELEKGSTFYVTLPLSTK